VVCVRATVVVVGSGSFVLGWFCFVYGLLSFHFGSYGCSVSGSSWFWFTAWFVSVTRFTLVLPPGWLLLRSFLGRRFGFRFGSFVGLPTFTTVRCLRFAQLRGCWRTGFLPHTRSGTAFVSFRLLRDWTFSRSLSVRLPGSGRFFVGSAAGSDGLPGCHFRLLVYSVRSLVWTLVVLSCWLFTVAFRSVCLDDLALPFVSSRWFTFAVYTVTFPFAFLTFVLAVGSIGCLLVYGCRLRWRTGSFVWLVLRVQPFGLPLFLFGFRFFHVGCLVCSSFVVLGPLFLVLVLRFVVLPTVTVGCGSSVRRF